MGYIYKITNLINNKIYVGQTRFDILVRYKQHKYEAQKGQLNFPLYAAMRKYGIENFSIEIIEEIDDSLLDERESFWIKKLDSYVKNNKGYNCTYGGEGNTIIDKLEVYQLWDQGNSIKQIADLLKHDRSAIRKILKEYENYSVEESNKRGDLIQGLNRFESVNQYDLKGNYIKTYTNMTQAAYETGISNKNIWSAVHYKSKTAGGYQWRFVNDTNPVQEISKTVKQKNHVQQLDEQNIVIQTYESAAEAARQTGINATQIRKVCQHKGITAGGYKWRYQSEVI